MIDYPTKITKEELIDMFEGNDDEIVMRLKKLPDVIPNVDGNYKLNLIITKHKNNKVYYDY